MAVLAGCGLIYEYLLSHYAGRVLGSVESAIYAMIGTMIVAMGMGAFLARWFKDAFTAFAWLESIIALIGMGCILAIASIIAVSYSLPHLFSSIFNIPPDVILNGYVFQKLQEWSRFLPYVFGLILGLFIGMEIPLIARIRQHVYGRFLENNAGTIYGADYIGAGIGAAIWVSIMLAMPIMQAAAWTALFNIIAGLAFLWRYHSYVRFAKLLLVCHILLLVLFAFILQFSSVDEQIYHSMLVYPAMLASNRHDRVLIIGGGDGLAMRDVLKWPVEEVTLIDLDGQLLNLFGHKDNQYTPPEDIKQRLVALNNESMHDPRANIIVGDAFLEVEKLLDQSKQFDTILIDLPDPNHPDLNKMYSDYFYNHVRQLLAPDGAMAVQSTSPYHAKKAFLSIAKTVKAAGFDYVEQYQQNIPSFGQWGWTIATKMGQSPSARISNITDMPVPSRWISKKYLLASFAFPNNYFEQVNDIEVNRLGSGRLYDYYRAAWQIESELYKN